MKRANQPTFHIIVLSIFLATAMVMFYITQRSLLALGQTQAKVNSLTANQAKLVDLESKLPTYSVQAEAWKRTLPANEKDVAGFAASIEGLARAQNLTIEISFDDFPGPVDVLGHYVAGLGAEITLEGSFGGVTNFLTSLSGLPYFYKIDKMTLTKPETKVGVKAVFNGALMMNQKI